VDWNQMVYQTSRSGDWRLQGGEQPYKSTTNTYYKYYYYHYHYDYCYHHHHLAVT
jgi:hypothetical protein